MTEFWVDVVHGIPPERWFKVTDCISSADSRAKFSTFDDEWPFRVGAEGAGTPANKARWVWQSESGEWFVSPRYGRTPIELAPGMNSIKCSSYDDVMENLAKLKALTSEGKLDAVLEAAASEIRRGARPSTLPARVGAATFTTCAISECP